jgi:hypothetical protein
LALDKLVSRQGIAKSNCVAIRAYYLDEVVGTSGIQNLTINGRRKDHKGSTYVNSEVGFGSVRIANDVDRVIYISDTVMEEGH